MLEIIGVAVIFSKLFRKCLQGPGVIRQRQTALGGVKPDNCTKSHLTGGTEGRERALLGLGGASYLLETACTQSDLYHQQREFEMETRYDEGTEQIRGGWQGKSVRCRENLFCPTIL